MNQNSENLNEAKYKVKIDSFEGPLDLLLHLVKTSEINIYDIPISEITRQYLNYLSFLIILNLDNLTEFVEMATILILIKSKAMLPVELDFDENELDPREELITKLLEYQKYKMAADLLEVMSEDSVPLVNRTTDPKLFNLDDNEDVNWKQLSVLDLIGAFADLLNKNNHNDMELEILLYNFTVEDKINLIKEILNDKDSFNYFELIKDNMPKMEIVCIFLALLELVKKGIIAVRQHKIFGDIHIVKKDKLALNNNFS